MEIENMSKKNLPTDNTPKETKENILVFVEDARKMNLSEFLIKFIPPAWTLIFDDMKDEVMDAGETIQSDLNKDGVKLVPNIEDIYNAFVSTPPDDIKVVIIGMDPYFKIHKGIPSATGRCFECRQGMPIEKSLQHIFSVCHKTINGFQKPKHGDLTKWAQQGVLLLNSSLTTRAEKAGAHLGAWRFLPEKLLRYFGEKKKNVVYMLWGRDAQAFEEFIPTHRNLILKSSHPVARGNYNTFLGSDKRDTPPMDHFNEANKYLEECGRDKIDWIL